MSDPFRLDDQVRYGTVLTAQEGDAVRSMARRIEEVGFDSIWAGDHVAFHIPIHESLTLLTFAAAVTERVTVGTSVYLLPLRHPTIAAKITSTLDRLSNGRLQLGVGVGGEYPPEFEASGVPVAERGSRTDEGIEILRKLWTQNEVEHRGRHFSFGPISLDPKPMQQGGPPILVGGRRAPAFRRAGQLGDGYISHMCAADSYRENLETMRRYAEELGGPPRRFRTAAFLFTILDDSWDRAHSRAVSALETIYRVPFDKAARKYCLLGRPDDCREQLQTFIDAGCRHFIFSPLMDPDEFLDRSGGELLPQLRKSAQA